MHTLNCLRALAAVVFLGSVLSATRAPAQDDKPIVPSLQNWIDKYKEIGEAQDKLRKNDIEGALESLKSATTKYVDLPPAEALMADFFFAANNQGAGISLLDSAVREHPADPEPYFMLGNIAFGQNRNTDAGLLFEKGAELLNSFSADPDRKRRLELRMHAGLASLAERDKDWQKALPHLQAWTKIDDKNAALKIRLARSLFNLKDGTKAYGELKKANQLNPGIPAPPFYIAQFYDDGDEEEMVAQWLSAAETRFGGHLPTRIALAEWQWKRKNVPEAKRHATKASEIDATAFAAALFSGIIAHYEQDYPTAEQNLEIAQKAAPDNFQARNHLAMVLAAEGDSTKTARALKLAESNMQKFPRSAEAAATLGWIHLQLGQNEQATRFFQMAGSTSRRTSNMAYFFASFLGTTGQTEQAMALLDQALASKTPFVFERDARQLLNELRQKS